MSFTPSIDVPIVSHYYFTNRPNEAETETQNCPFLLLDIFALSYHSKLLFLAFVRLINASTKATSHKTTAQRKRSTNLPTFDEEQFYFFTIVRAYACAFIQSKNNEKPTPLCVVPQFYCTSRRQPSKRASDIKLKQRRSKSSTEELKSHSKTDQHRRQKTYNPVQASKEKKLPTKVSLNSFSHDPGENSSGREGEGEGEEREESEQKIKNQKSKIKKPHAHVRIIIWQSWEMTCDHASEPGNRAVESGKWKVRKWKATTS